MSSDRHTAVVIVDVDGVVSAVRPESSAWGDEVEVGRVFGPVVVSAQLALRMDALNALQGVECWWLTSWSSAMRSGMHPFPGRAWGTIPEPPTRSAARKQNWWKLDALNEWLPSRPDVKAVAWCDDHMRGGRPRAARRVLAERGVEDVLLLAPRTSVGLTPEHVARLEVWAAARSRRSAGRA